MLEQRRIGDQKGKYPADSLRIRLEDLRRQILPLTNLRNRIPSMVDQFKTRSDNDVELQKIENAKLNWEMEKNNSTEDPCQSQVSGKLHRLVELSQTINQERWPPHEKAEQDEAKSSDCQRMEQQDVFEQDHISRSILMEEQDRVKQTDQSHSVTTSSHLDNGRIAGFMGLTSSNQRETAAVLCGLLRSAPFLREQQVQSLKIETDNSSTAYNLNRGAAAISLLKLTDRILEVAEDLELQMHAFHIHGKENTIPDSLSRLATSGDYSLKEEILQEVL
ncbi:MAG: hypothetical protein EZS28_018983, partial [Streblomastix strix]